MPPRNEKLLSKQKLNYLAEGFYLEVRDNLNNISLCDPYKEKEGFDRWKLRMFFGQGIVVEVERIC